MTVTTNQSQPQTPVAVAKQRPQELTGRRRAGRPTAAETNLRNKRSEQSDFLTGCTIEERAFCIRLIRLLRTNYWLSNFASQLLDLDAGSPERVTIEMVQAQLEEVKIVEELVEKVQYIGRCTGNWFQNHPAIRAVTEEWGDELFRYKSDRDIRKLIESSKPVVSK